MEESMRKGSWLGWRDRGRLARIFLDPTRADGTPAVRHRLFCSVGLVAAFSSQALSAEYLEGNERQKARAYSPAVVTEGGRIVWLAGQTGGNTGDFETQAREAFHQLDLTLKRAGGSLADMVTMTVFINDPRNGDRLTELRREIFPAGRYPGSALITVSNFAVPGILIEIQGVAVIGDRCSNANPCSPR
jgi:2-iminobutanoate/2-iminopropanoate deaminase